MRDALSEGASITVRGSGEAHKVAGGKGSQIRTSEYGISFTTYYATEADASYFHYAPSASELNGNGVYSQPYLNQTTNHVVIDVSYKMYLARTAGCTVAPELHEETDGAFTALDDAHGTLQTESDGSAYFLVSDEGYTWYSLKIEPGYERGEDFAILQGDTALEWQTESPGETRMQKFLMAPALLRSGEDEGETLYFRVSADDQTELTITGIEQQTVTLKGLSLVFDDIPRLKYYCVIPDSLKSDPDAYLAFLSEEGEELSRTPISEGTAGTYKNTPCTIFYYSVVPKAAEDVVHLRFFTGDGTPVRLVTGSGKDYSEQGFPFSMKDYAENMKVHGSTEKMRNLAAALDDYCAAAVTYFGTGNSPVSAELANITPEMLAPYAVVKEGVLPAGIVKPQMSVMFQTDNSIRVYFVYDKNSGKAPTDYTYTIDGEQAELLERDGQYYLTVTGIGAKELGIAHTFSVSDGTDTYSITASTLTYAGLLLGQNKEASKNLGRALYQYCKAAEANFAS